MAHVSSSSSSRRWFLPWKDVRFSNAVLSHGRAGPFASSPIAIFSLSLSPRGPRTAKLTKWPRDSLSTQGGTRSVGARDPHNVHFETFRGLRVPSGSFTNGIQVFRRPPETSGGSVRLFASVHQLLNGHLENSFESTKSFDVTTLFLILLITFNER